MCMAFKKEKIIHLQKKIYEKNLDIKKMSIFVPHTNLMCRDLISDNIYNHQ